MVLEESFKSSEKHVHNIRRIIDMQEYSRILIEELREALQDLDDFLFGY